MIVSLSNQSISNSYCVSMDQIIVEGRCRDYTALREKKQKSVVEIKIIEGNREGNMMDNLFRFVCLKHSTLPTQSASLTASIVVKINALSDLNKVDESNTFNTVESYGIKKLIKWLKYNLVTVIFCSDTMHDDVVHLVALEGITTVRELRFLLFLSLSL